MSTAIEPIQISVEVPVPVGRAFELWTTELADWWPAAYTFNGDDLERIEIEPVAGGRCLEDGGSAGEVVWGRVLDVEAPSKLLVSWLIAPDRTLEADPRSASELALSLRPLGEGSVVEVEHRELARHGAGAAGYREALAAEQGWPWLVDLFDAAACA